MNLRSKWPSRSHSLSGRFAEVARRLFNGQYCGEVFTAEHAEIAEVILQLVSLNLFSAPSACSAVTCHRTCDTAYWLPAAASGG